MRCVFLATAFGLSIATWLQAAPPAAPRATVGPPPTVSPLYDFENDADLKDWAPLRETERPEPAPRIEFAKDHATSGGRGLEVTFDGGHLPAVTTNRVPVTDPKDWQDGASLTMDLVLSEPAVVGVRVLQEKGRRFAEWSKQIPRWQMARQFGAGRHADAFGSRPDEVQAAAIQPDLGKVVAIDIFVCNPAKGLKLHVDNIRLARPASAPKIGVRHDLGIYPQPAPPPLPKAGGVVTDPTFGTEILRVTDEDDGSSHTAYSYWPSFNKDSTLLHVNTEKGGPTLYRFDPVAFRIIEKEPLFARDDRFPGGVSWEDCIWSGSDPHVIYGHCGGSLVSYDVDKRAHTLVKDFAEELPGEYPHQISKSLDDNVFAFTTKKLKTYEQTGYAVWQRDKDRIILQERGAEFDEVQVDKSGRWLVAKTSEQGKGIKNVFVYDLQTGGKRQLTDDGPDYSPGHSDLGFGVCVGADNWRNATTFRRLDAPHMHYEVLDLSGGHLSMLADDESWVLMSNYDDQPPAKGTPWGTFAQEIYQVSTDGSQRVRRLCHHFSDVRGTYWHSPRANISRDGRYVAFTSNWGDPRLAGVFILRVPPTEGRNAPSAPTAESGR